MRGLGGGEGRGCGEERGQMVKPEGYGLKDIIPALAGVAHVVECLPIHKRLSSLTLRAHRQVVGSTPSWVAHGRQPTDDFLHIHISNPPPSLSLSLSINK